MYVILDLETTGLDPEHEAILEIGILILDDKLAYVSNFSEVIHWDELMELEDAIIVPDSVPDRVLEMHEVNGLWRESLDSTKTLRQVEQEAVDFLTEQGAKGQELTGNTISFDRAFLRRHMPRLEAAFHYRNIDISSLNVLGNKYGIDPMPDSYSHVPAEHRAGSDCIHSAYELKWYLDKIGWVK